MYGYDFMIDEDYRPYLIEVNSSPCMEYSTHVTEKLVKAGLEGIGMLVCDYMLNKKTPKSMDHYGGWRLIYNKWSSEFENLAFGITKYLAVVLELFENVED